jgi:hypothetical protein
MPKRKDENETAFDTLQEILRRDAERDGIPQPPKPEPEKVSYRVKAGRKGGKIGGKARADANTPLPEEHTATHLIGRIVLGSNGESFPATDSDKVNSILEKVWNGLEKSDASILRLN